MGWSGKKQYHTLPSTSSYSSKSFHISIPPNRTHRPLHIALPSMRMAPSGIRPSPLGIALAALLVIGTLYWLSSDYTKHEEYVSMKELLISSIEFSERGGVVVKQLREDPDLEAKSKGDTKEGAKMLVTQGDLLSHRVMYQSFQNNFPHVYVVSEEKDSVPSDRDTSAGPAHNQEVDAHTTGDDIVSADDITVWIDPLDATQEYSEELTQYVTTMVCIAVKGQPIVGVVHKPWEGPKGKTYWSWVGHGSNIEDKSTTSSNHKIIVSRSHAGNVKDVAMQAFGEGTEVIPAGGAGYKVVSLFEDIASVYVHTTAIKKWDICPGAAILSQAGGRMTTLDGSEIDFSNKNGPLNSGGIIAAIKGHDDYQRKLGKVLEGA